MNKAYVYEWYNVDTNEVFYVGKGRNNRMHSMKNRNQYFLRYVEKYNCDCRIVKDNMTDDEAYQYEKELIEQYKKDNQCQTNIAEGGKGGIRLLGEDNPMFGRTWWDENTPLEKIQEWKDKVKHCGKDNPQYGVSLKERMSPETYAGWIEAHKLMTGENNPNFGNRKLSKFYKDNPEAAKEKQGRHGKKNGRCVPIDLYDGENFIKHFDYIKECANYMIENYGIQTKQENLSIQITIHKNNGKPYKGFYFK